MISVVPASASAGTLGYVEKILRCEIIGVCLISTKHGAVVCNVFIDFQPKPLGAAGSADPYRVVIRYQRGDIVTCPGNRRNIRTIEEEARGRGFINAPGEPSTQVLGESKMHFVADAANNTKSTLIRSKNPHIGTSITNPITSTELSLSRCRAPLYKQLS